MVLQHIQSKQNKQNVTVEAEKNPNSNSNANAAATASRGRNTSASKAPVRSKDRASNVNIRDVNLDDVKLMEPKWRSKKYDKITMVTNGNGQQDDQCASDDNAWRERKLTLRDFMVTEKSTEINAAQVHKQLGMCTSEYIVVAEQANAAHERAEAAATITECEEPEDEQDEAKPAAEVQYSEELEDDFVVINVH